MPRSIGLRIISGPFRGPPLPENPEDSRNVRAGQRRRRLLTYPLTAIISDLHGNIADQTRESLDGGWRLLLGQCLKEYAETGKRPAAADAGAPPCSAS